MLSFSVAMDKNKGIGFMGQLPWHIKEELQLFKKNTLGKNIIMGHTTYDNLPKQLLNRNIFVVSDDPDYNPPGVQVIRNLTEFFIKHQTIEEEYIICGGASIYKQAYKYCKKAYVSFIKGDYNIDAWFHRFNLNDWYINKKEEYEEFTYMELTRKSNRLTLVRFSEHELEFSDGTILKPRVGEKYDRTLIEAIMEAGYDEDQDN